MEGGRQKDGLQRSSFHLSSLSLFKLCLIPGEEEEVMKTAGTEAEESLNEPMPKKLYSLLVFLFKPHQFSQR